MRLRSNQKGRFVVELMLVMPFLVALVLVSSEIARFVRCRQAAVVLASEIGKSVYRSCGELVEAALTTPSGTISASDATRFRIDICLRDVMQRGAGTPNESGYNRFGADLAKYLNVQSMQVRVSVFDAASTAPLSTFPATSQPVSRFNTSSSVLRPSTGPSGYIGRRGRYVVVEVFFPVSGMMSFSRAFRLGGVESNGVVYEAAIF